MLINRHRLGVRILAAFVLLCALFACRIVAHAAPPVGNPATSKNILLLYSYGHGSQGVGIFDDGFLQRLSAGGYSTSQLFFEYLDLERNRDDPNYRLRMQDLLDRKYRGRQIDLIVTVQQPALTYLLNEGTGLAQDAPVISVQAPMPSESEVGKRRVVSELAAFDMKGTLERALELFPNTRRVVFVSGASEADRNLSKQAASVAQPWQGRLEFEYTTEIALDAMLKRVASLPERTIIIFTQYNRDVSGKVAVAYEVEAAIIKAANAPVFGLYDFNLVNGGIGGSVVGVKSLGESTGKLALDLLNGKRQLTQPVTSVGISAFPMFDWEQIKRWDGDASRLSGNPVFVNRVPTFWDLYKLYVVGVAAFILVQSMLIAILVVNRRRRKMTEHALKKSEARHRAVTETAHDAIVTSDSAGNIVGWNQGAQTIFGYTESEIMNRSVAVLMPERYRDQHLAGMKRIDSGGEHRVIGKTVQLHGLHKDASEFPLELSLAKWESSEGWFVSGVIRDISEHKQHEAEQLLVSQRMQALLKLPTAAEGRNETELLQYGLEQIEALTGSRIAFVHFVHDDQETIELLTWSQSTLKDYCTATVDRHYPISQAGIWADALRQRRPVLVNDYANAVGKHGLPEGHAHLDRLISVPVMEGGLVRMMLGVGNKPQPYSEFDMETTRLLAESLWHIASQRRAEASLRASEGRLRLMFDRASDGIMTMSAGGKLLAVNEAFCRMHGYSQEEMSSLYLKDLDTPETSQQVPERMQRVLSGQEIMFDVEHYHKDGHVIALEVSATLIVLEGEPVIQTFHRDVTEHRQSEQQIQRLAFSDPLTGLPNRRLLMDRLEQAIAAAHRQTHQLALLFIDLDNFKTLNDTLGHDRGDLLLRQVATRLTACVREGDTVARLGGDEFIVLLSDLSSDPSQAAKQAQLVTEKILDALGQPYLLDGHAHHSTSSIGVSLFGGAVRANIEEPLKRAELAMYQAKAAGRNTMRFFEPEMQTTASDRATLEAQLREAVNKNQFVLYYQPQGGENVRLTGVEALLRWQHPQRGSVSPTEFIPVAEASGLILPLGQWVLQTACKQLAAWSARPEMAHLTMAVNVSARQFRQPDFVAEVMSVLHATGARPERLKLELTESVLVDNVEDIIIKMNALKASGVGFSLDDFGTGYSSLSYLKRLPLDQLKIDQSFVRDILTDPNDAAIAKMVIVLAESLGLKVIAEGVETVAQRDFLANIGCHAYQGYLFSRPLLIDEFEAFVKRV